MKLTGKCREEYLMQKKIRMCDFDSLPESCQNALIIEFFDSVGIWNKVFLDCYEDGIGNYKDATNEAIEKANYLFNSK